MIFLGVGGQRPRQRPQRSPRLFHFIQRYIMNTSAAQYADLDMDIDNYSLEDVLALFKLNYVVSEDDLKQAKKTVMQTHPDKSGLPKEYFLFFTAAFKVVHGIYSFRNRSTAVVRHNYQDLVEDDKDSATEALVQKIKNKDNFNTVFNELFEKYNYESKKEEGYGDWLKSDDDLDTRQTTLGDMTTNFERKKQELSALIPVQKVNDMGSSSGTDLVGGKPEYYSAAMFSSLPYEDLRKAHVESVIPVSHEDYLRRPKFNSVEELQRDQAYNDVRPPSLQQAQHILKERQSVQDYDDTSRAFLLARQTEQAIKVNGSFLSQFKTLMH